MKVDILPGKHVLAVSGGVDSMVLLDVLRQKPDVELIVAHFNHGIRPDSQKDEKLVAGVAKKYDLPFEAGHGSLGTAVSEGEAREARYKFLESVAEKFSARGITTAHHQDDSIETAFINILRGTGRTGLSSISSSKIHRPMLRVPKKEILAYAKKNNIVWREDSTNSDTRYLRNYIRAHITSRLTSTKKAEIVDNLDKVAKLNKTIDDEIATLSHIHHTNRLDRRAYVMLPSQVGEELLMHFLRQNNLGHFDKKTIARLNTVIKTGQPGSEHDVINSHKLKLTVRSALLV